MMNRQRLPKIGIIDLNRQRGLGLILHGSNNAQFSTSCPNLDWYIYAVKAEFHMFGDIRRLSDYDGRRHETPPRAPNTRLNCSSYCSTSSGCLLSRQPQGQTTFPASPDGPGQGTARRLPESNRSAAPAAQGLEFMPLLA